MSNSIVLVNESVVLAPTPSQLQATGAAISQGATTLAAQSYSFLTQDSDLTALLAAPLALTSLVWSGGTVVATASANIPGLTTGDVFISTIAGAAPSGYDGTYICTVTGTTTFTYALSANPGTETVPGTFTPANQAELIAMVYTFFAQGTGQGVYVLELGPGDGTSSPPNLSTFIQQNPGVFYSYLVPRDWDGTSAFLALANQYTAPNSKTYFFATTSSSGYAAYPKTKAFVTLVETPASSGRPLIEFSAAADFQHTLSYAPSASNKMTPNSFAYLFDVTAYPSFQNNALLNSILAANSNYVGTGAQGGISNTILYEGTTQDGNDFAWWYSADWAVINVSLNVANAVIAGSQNKINPLVYDQFGINQLQDVAVSTVKSAISFGLATGTVTQTTLDPVTFSQNLDNGVYAGQNVVNAVPFPTYTALNPSDYGNGKYAGFTVVYIPQTGFKQIVFGVLVTNLLTL